MSLEEGAINYTDLSPNANIQGHQIADKTLRLRNFSDDTFGIVKTGSVTHQGISLGAGITDTVTIPHGLGYFPAFLVYTIAPAFLYNWAGTNTGRTVLPITYVLTGTTLIYLYPRVDTTNLYIDFFNTSSGVQDLSPYSWTFTYYLLQESAATA